MLLSSSGSPKAATLLTNDMNEQMLLFPDGILYTAKEIAQKFGRSLCTVYRWRRRLGLNACGPSPRTLFFTGEELKKLFLPRPAPPVAKAKGKRQKAKPARV